MNRLTRYRIWVKPILLTSALLLAGAFIWYSYDLTHDLSVVEKERMSLWAAATHELASPDPDPLSFPLEVIEGNRSIPVLLTDDNGTVINFRNIKDTAGPGFEKAVEHLLITGNRIDIEYSPGEIQHIYYEDSELLKRLSRYPWIELIVIIAFLIVAYIGFNSLKRMEQNRLWVGLSKETAHQLGTPISSLLGWIDYLKMSGINDSAITEMERDVKRLSDVSARFSKIGSRPYLSIESVKDPVENSVNYMRERLSNRIIIKFKSDDGDYRSQISPPLIQWVFENLIKNAADATSGSGAVDVIMTSGHERITIFVSDTGKGIPKNYWKRIFQAGYTTKARGWGLGLTLTKRIIENYHGGKIEVVESTLNKGTVFKIVLPKAVHK